MTFQGVKNWFIFLGQQWLDSLKVLLPGNFKLFALVVLNAWWQSAKVLLKYFWWLPIAAWLLVTQLPSGRIDFPFFLIWSIPVQTIGKKVVDLCELYLFLCAVRPSAGIKNFWYFLSYLPHAFFFCLYIPFVFLIIFPVIQVLVIFVVLLDLSFRWLLSKFFPAPGIVKFFESIVWILYFFLVAPISQVTNICIGFFFFDGQITAKNCLLSVIRGIKLAWYGLPFCLLTGPLFVLVYKADVLLSTLPGQRVMLAPVFIMLMCATKLLYFCILNTFYVKRVHEDYELYF